MKPKKIIKNIKKIPLLCLLIITVFLADACYDGILPWPSPIHITVSITEGNGFIDDLRNDGNRTEPDSIVSDPEHASDNPENTLPSSDNDTLTELTDETDQTHEADPGANAQDTVPENNVQDTVAENNMLGTVPDFNAFGTLSGNDASGTLSGNDAFGTLSGNDAFGTLSGNDASDTLSGNDASGTLSGNDASGGAGTNSSIVYGEDGLPIVSYMTVENQYFDDAVFIGDSRTRSLQLYADLGNATFLADTGLTIYTVLDKKITPSTMTTKTTVRDYLSRHRFKKIYLMLGVNELGTGTAASFAETYRKTLETIRELQPDAIIYVQAIIHISKAKHGEGTYINNNTIIERNEALRALADNVHIFWLDANPVLCSDNGFLIDSYTFDGVHLQAKYVSVWTDWLKQHAVITQ